MANGPGEQPCIPKSAGRLAWGRRAPAPALPHAPPCVIWSSPLLTCCAPTPADDLGDLMQQMREGAAWAEGLVMEGHLSPAPPTAGTAGAAPSAAGAAAELDGYPSHARLLSSPAPAAPADLPPEGAAPAGTSPAGQAAAGDDGGSPDLGPATLAAVSRRQQREAEQDAAMSEMQPAMRALLMHPGVAGSKQLMIPVCGATPPPPVGSPAPARGPAPQGLSCAAALAASRPGGCPPAWPHPQLAAHHFFQQPGHFGIPRGAAPPFAYFQAPPVSFVPAPPADCSPQASLDVAAAPAWQQPHHQHSGGAYVPLPNSGGPGCLVRSRTTCCANLSLRPGNRLARQPAVPFSAPGAPVHAPLSLSFDPSSPQPGPPCPPPPADTHAPGPAQHLWRLWLCQRLRQHLTAPPQQL